MNVKVMSWVEVIRTIWGLQSRIEKRIGRPVDTRTIELTYGAAVSETLIRYQGPAIRKMTPRPAEIAKAYAASDRSGLRNFTVALVLNSIETIIGMGDRIAGWFGKVNGDQFVAASACQPLRAQLMYHLNFNHL